MIRFILTLTLGLGLGLGLACNAQVLGSCHKIRSAFDIGSGSTKLKIAQVDTCKQIINKVLLETSVPVKYKEDLQKNSSGKFSQKIMQEGIEALKNLLAKVRKHKSDEIFAVTTSAARNALNADDFLNNIDKELKLKVFLISQTDEAKLGYVAAKSIALTSEKNLIIWDIGGGSMQMTYKDQNNFEFYEGKMASVSFKNHIVKSIQNKKGGSPNPIGISTYKQAKHDAKIAIKFSVPDSIKLKLARQGIEVIGIGGVHYHSVASQLNAKKKGAYTLRELSDLIPKRLALSDNQLGSKFTQTEVSNLVLVEAIMEQLGINKVRVANINLADGLLLSGETLLRK